jgi:N-acetylmuramoyl-L-alanine amidase
MRRVACVVLLSALAAAPLAGSAHAQNRVPTALPPPPPNLNRVVAVDARLAGDEKRTRLIFDLTRTVELHAFVLGDPYRVIVDLPNVTFDLPKTAGREGRGLISAYRYGLFAPGKARIVIDASGPVAIDKAFVLAERDEQPARLVIDLVPATRAEFLKQTAAQKKVQMIAALPAAIARGLPPSDGKPVIVIDPGHGGPDTGALSRGGEEEKTIVLAVAQKLRDQLEQRGRYRVVLTRSDDTFIPLADRVKIARTNGAALFISIHADSISRGEGEARGATVYTVSDRASDAEAAKLADKENKSDLIAGVDLSNKSSDVAGILVDLAHRETKNFSGTFARTLVGRMQAATRMHKSPLRSAGFIVLRAPDVPSVLLELGFLSHPEDVKLLASGAWRDRVTEAMVEAVQNFFESRLAEAR